MTLKLKISRCQFRTIGVYGSFLQDNCVYIKGIFLFVDMVLNDGGDFHSHSYDQITHFALLSDFMFSALFEAPVYCHP
mgnify:CR=1 FL=1